MINKILLVDGNNLFKRAFHSKKTIKSGTAKIDTVYYFLTFLRTCLKKFEPNRIFVFWDGEDSGYYRHLIYPDYKANRKSKSWTTGVYTPEEKVEKETQTWQRRRIEHYLEILGVDSISYEKIEADDLIAKATIFFKNEENKIIIVSNDYDLNQLINDNVTLYSHISDYEINIENWFHKNYHHPANIKYEKIVTGDASDNITKQIRISWKKFRSILGNRLTKPITVETFKSICLNELSISENKLEKLLNVIQILDLQDPILTDYCKHDIYRSLLSIKRTYKLNEFQSSIIEDGIMYMLWKKNNIPDVLGFTYPFVKYVSSSFEVPNIVIGEIENRYLEILFPKNSMCSMNKYDQILLKMKDMLTTNKQFQDLNKLIIDNQLKSKVILKCGNQKNVCKCAIQYQLLKNNNDR